jgi:hypothetical protein
MAVEPDANPRIEPPARADERTTLLAFLQWQRATFELKAGGLDPADLARRALDFSSMSLLGLVRHMADVELGWFRRVMSGEPDTPRHYSSPDDPDGDFDGAVADPAVVADAWATWRAEVAFTDRFVAGAADLDVTGDDPWRGATSLRWVLVHMIEEYARHNGHADLLRQRIDGAVGE